MSGMPEIGSKISLISKADIRYEGKLFTVNPNECTIALASVRSYGTEDREVENPVPPQPQTYDFILFRGSDIKDIRVVNNQLPNDPAIVQMTVPPSMGTSSYQPDSFNPLLGQMGTSMANQYSNMYNPMSSMAPGMGRTIIKPQQPQQQQQPQSQPQMNNVLEFIGGSRSSTPGLLGSRKSPTIDQGVQVSAPEVSFGGHPKDDKNQNRTNQNSYQRDGNRNRGGGGGAIGDRPYNDGYRGGNDRDFGPQRRDTYSINHIRPNMQQQPVGSQGQQMRVQNNQGSGQGRGGWINRGGGGGGGGMRGRGRGGSQGQQNFNRAPGQQLQQQSNNSQKNKTLKFEGDYDFDKANTEFEELRSQLAKVKIAEGAEAAVKLNGEDKKDDSGNETGIGEGEQEEEEQTVYYDKAKSFFDNISCEAVERSKGRSQRTDWRTERKLNSEAFGVASARRGGFRGRGGYYSGGRGLYHSGGRGGGGGGNYRGNYNRGQGNRQRNNTNSLNSSNRPHLPTAAGMVNQNNNG